MKLFSRIVFIGIIAVLVAGIGLGGAAIHYMQAPQNTPEDPFFRVKKGDSVRTIAERLHDRGFIRTDLSFVLYSKLMRTEKNLQIGYYNIPSGADLIELHDILLRGRQHLVSVTIPEGYTLSRIAELIEEKKITSAEAFLQAAESKEVLRSLNIPASSAEGYLYPDTYRLALDTPAEALLSHIVNTFFRKIKDLDIDPDDWAEDEFHERIILSSIVEREYRVADEAPLIASVFLNRLEINMPLQSCATVVYVLTEEQGKEHPNILTYRDLEEESPFNTYENYGLPPAPICNAGEVSLGAAFFPAKTDYLYFLVEDPKEGRHRFTTTLSEHNDAKRLYIKSE